MSHIEYNTNNSGGSYWLKHEDWKKLEEAGWEVDWFDDKQKEQLGDRTPAWYARKYNVSMRLAKAEFSDITGQDPDEEGCNCCGQPHSFYQYDDEGKMSWY